MSIRARLILGLLIWALAVAGALLGGGLWMAPVAFCGGALMGNAAACRSFGHPWSYRGYV